MNFQGEISGTGVAVTRENEITADRLAEFRNFVVGHEYGVVQSEYHDFHAWVDGGDMGGTPFNLNVEYSNTIHLTDGLLFAYGYFGYIPATDITFSPPAVEQYHIIYAEIDRSIIPNTFKLATKNNQASSSIMRNSFRQDVLSTVKTGVFQIPLWIVRVTNKGIRIEPLSPQCDLRRLISKIKNVYKAENTQHVTKSIGNTVTAATQPQGANNKTVANCAFAQREIRAAVNQ